MYEGCAGEGKSTRILNASMVAWENESGDLGLQYYVATFYSEIALAM